MGIGCTIIEEKENNSTDNINSQIKIEKKVKKELNSQNEIINERVIPGSPFYIGDEKLEIIRNQKDNSICKIIKNDKPIGTGFLCSIQGEYKKRINLITAYHVIGEEDLKIGNQINLSFNDNKNKLKKIKIDNSRRIYASEDYDIVIIEITDNDDLKKNNILEIDENIFTESDLNKYINESIYILHYPQGNFACLSIGIIKNIDKNNTIFHLCSTEHGSSGSPILNLDTLKVIGIHQAYDKSEKTNVGAIIKEPINNYNKENKILLTLKINENELGQKIYFIKENEFYLKNAILFINNEIYKSENYFKPKKEGIYKIKIIFNILLKDCSRLFSDCNNLINIDFSSFDSKNVTDMSYMFNDCKNLIKLDFSSFDTKNVTDMSYMFNGCKNLINLDLSSFDTKKVTDMSGMFCDCENLLNFDLSSFDKKSITELSNMFKNYENLNNINLSSFDTKNVSKMSRMFRHCKNLFNIDLSSFDTKNVTDMSYMFSDCEKLFNLDLSSFDTKNVTDMSFMFNDCINLINLDLSSFDTKKVTDMSGMFSNCSRLNNINLSSFDIKNATNISAMLNNCGNCQTLNNIISEDTIQRGIQSFNLGSLIRCFLG